MNGAKTSCTPAFIQAVTPEVAVISAEADNWRGVPAPQTLARLRDAAIYRTDQHGAVGVISDGQTFWVEPDREGF
jgi:competence protein ComEC